MIKQHNHRLNKPKTSISIASPIASGSGASLIHSFLEQRIPGYNVYNYNPLLTLLPPLLLLRKKSINQPSIIHTAPDYATFFSSRTAKLVITFHSFVWDRETQKYSTPMQRLHHQSDLRLFVAKALKKADMVTSVSQFISNLIKSEFRYQKTIKVIYNGIDTSAFIPLSQRSNDKIRVLFSGNLTRRKGAKFLPHIAEKLDKEISLAYTSGLRANNILPSQPNLINLGNIPYSQMPEIYQNSDILVFPSVREGFGLAVAEAMACGLPVVASNCSAIPELVVDGRGGYLCNVGDINDFADKINTLAGNPELRRKMGDFNRKRAEKYFTIERMVEEYRELFDNILADRIPTS